MMTRVVGVHFFRQTKSGILLGVNSGDQKRHSGKLLISFHFAQKPHGCFKKNGIPFRKKTNDHPKSCLGCPFIYLSGGGGGLKKKSQHEKDSDFS